MPVFCFTQSLMFHRIGFSWLNIFARIFSLFLSTYFNLSAEADPAFHFDFHLQVCFQHYRTESKIVVRMPFSVSAALLMSLDRMASRPVYAMVFLILLLRRPMPRLTEHSNETSGQRCLSHSLLTLRGCTESILHLEEDYFPGAHSAK